MPGQFLPVVAKVVAYIVVDDRVAVFEHRDHPEAGLQVPAGTVRDGEALPDAALREAEEETGLTDLSIVGHLGDATYDVTPFGRRELHHRSCFHLACGQRPLASTWSHPELHDGRRPPTWFEFRWLPVDLLDGQLIAGQGTMAHKLGGDPPGAADPEAGR